MTCAKVMVKHKTKTVMPTDLATEISANAQSPAKKIPPNTSDLDAIFLILEIGFPASNDVELDFQMKQP